MRHVLEVPGWQERLFLPGPTPLPWAVAQAGAHPMTDPRSEGFAQLVTETVRSIAQMAGTEGEVAILPASGTGALEALCQNLFQPGDPVLCVVAGAFGRRFAEIAAGQGLLVTRLEVPMGEAPNSGELAEAVTRGPEGASGASFRGLLLTHNETSTGVLLPVEELIREARRARPGLLSVVDSISGFPSVPLDMDRAGIDAVAAASQKGFMTAPGLAVLLLGPRGVAAYQEKRPGRFYFDLGPFLKGHFPYTAPVSLWYALAEAVRLLDEEGQEARSNRHVLLGRMVRAAGLALHVPPRAMVESVASPTVTALRLPQKVAPADLRKDMLRHGVRIAGAMGAWSEDTVRVGHVGAILPVDLLGAIAALEDSLARLLGREHLPLPFAPGDGVKAAFLAMHEFQEVMA